MKAFLSLPPVTWARFKFLKPKRMTWHVSPSHAHTVTVTRAYIDSREAASVEQS